MSPRRLTAVIAIAAAALLLALGPHSHGHRLGIVPPPFPRNPPVPSNLYNTQTSEPVVGTVGSTTFGTLGNPITPAFGASENRTAGNLLIAWVQGYNTTTLPTTPAGWSIAAQIACSATCSTTIFYKVAVGADAAPTIAGATGTTWKGRLAEFSGTNASAPLDQAGTIAEGAGTNASPLVATAANPDAYPNELAIGASVALYSNVQTDTLSDTFNNGTYDKDPTDTGSSSKAASGLPRISSVLTNVRPDSNTWSFNTNNLPNGAAATVIASFLPIASAITPVLPSITGPATLGSILTASHAAWRNDPRHFTFQWQDCDSGGASCANIVGATGQQYSLGNGDVTHTIRVVETACNTIGCSSSPATSSQTAVVVSAGGTGTFGASQATCSNSPCGPMSAPVSTSLTTGCDANPCGGGSNDSGNTTTHNYYVLTPAGLTPSSGNKPPAVLVFGGNTGPGTTCQYGANLASTIAAQKMLEVEMTCDQTIGNWQKEWVNSASRATPDDQPWVKGVIQAVEQCPGSCADPNRIYLMGTSSGGNMVADVLCDGGVSSSTNNSLLVRGGNIDSSSMQIYNGGANYTGFGGSPNCPSINTHLFVMQSRGNQSQLGGYDGQFYNNNTNPHLDDGPAATWPCQAASLGNHNATCVGIQAYDYWAGHLGCPTTADGTTGLWDATNVTSDTLTAQAFRFRVPSTGCSWSIGGDQVESVGIINAGHEYSCEDSDTTASQIWPASSCTTSMSPVGLSGGYPQTGGLNVEKEFFRFIDAGESP